MQQAFPNAAGFVAVGDGPEELRAANEVGWPFVEVRRLGRGVVGPVGWGHGEVGSNGRVGVGWGEIGVKVGFRGQVEVDWD